MAMTTMSDDAFSFDAMRHMMRACTHSYANAIANFEF